MIHPTQTLSRIARKPDRPAAAAAHTASLVAVVTTLIMVGTGQVAESNPASAYVHATIGLEAWVVATPILVGAALKLPELLPWSRLRRAMPRAIVAVCSIDAIGNLAAIARIGLPDSLLLESVATTIASTVFVAGAVYYRRELVDFATSVPRPSWETTRAVALSIIMLTAIPAGVAFVGTQPLDGSNGTASAATTNETAIFHGSTSSNDGRVYRTNGTGVETAKNNLHTGSNVMASDTGTNNDYLYTTGDSAGTGKKVIQSHKSNLTQVNSYSTTDIPSAITYVGETNRVWVGDYSGNLLEFDENLNLLNTYSISGNVITDIEAGPNGSIYAVDGGDSLRKINSTDGTQMWSYTTGSVSTVRVDSKGAAYFGGYQSGLEKVDSSGNSVWHVNTTESVRDIDIGPNKSVYWGGDDQAGKVDPDTGSTLETYGFTGITGGLGFGDDGNLYLRVS